MSGATEAVLRRFDSGDYIVTLSCRSWWARNGRLIARVTAAETDAVMDLQRTGVLVRETGREHEQAAS